MSKLQAIHRLPEHVNHVIIQNGQDSLDHLTTRMDSLDYCERMLQNFLSIMPLLKEKCRSEEKQKEKESDVLLTVEEAAEFIKVSRPTIYELINSGELPCLAYGDRKQKRIWRSELINLGNKKDR